MLGARHESRTVDHAGQIRSGSCLLARSDKTSSKTLSMPARTIWRVRDAGSKAPVWKPNQAQLGAKRAEVAQMEAFY